MFRGTPRAFAADPLARRIAREAINHRLDASLREEERMFLYLPFEHSEHHSIIERFGRFPHRNAVLGRQSTPEELAALEDPANSF